MIHSYNLLMTMPILMTKLYIPELRSTNIPRSYLLEKLNGGLHRKFTLVSAPAGFGKTSLVSEWVRDVGRPVAWFSLDERDNDLTRFLIYFCTALKAIDSEIGVGTLARLESSPTPPIELTLIALVNEIAQKSKDFIFVLDDFHVIDSSMVENVIAFLLEHQPPQMHLVMTTREDPRLRLSQLRARNELTELRIKDLRFTSSETAGFLNNTMELKLPQAEIDILETRTEGWIVGLQLAALSLQGHSDKTQFIESFSGSNQYVLDYLLEEVMQQQPEDIQTFLLCTSILDRLCGSLCDAIIPDSSNSGQEKLEYLERTNLFLIPLDNERHWYRYHYLFADLLRQRLLRDSTGFSTEDVNALHTQASIWYEANGLELEAFQHAIEINDIERAERLIESQSTPLYLRGIVKPILHWLESLPHHILDAHPALWVAYASTLLLTGQHTSVEQKLNEAENALQNTELDDTAQDIMGRIASMQATLAVIQNDIEAIISHSNDALERLHPENLPIRIASHWTRGYAYQLQGNHRLARNAYQEVLQLSESDEKSFYVIVATISLGQLQELDNQLHQASESYQGAIKLSGEPPHPIVSEAYLGLTRINYQWNDFESAEEYGQQCYELLQHMDSTDTTASYKVFLAYLHLSRKDFTSANDVLVEAETFVRQNNFMFRLPDIVEAQVHVLIHRDNLTTALQLTETHNLPTSQARIYLAQKKASRALQILIPFIQKAKETGLQSEHLKGLVLQAVVYNALGKIDTALEVLDESLALAKHGGFIRMFVDEGSSMAQLLQIAHSKGLRQDYVRKLLFAFSLPIAEQSAVSQTSQLIDPLSQREIEVLQLIARGLTNQEIADQLYLSLHTVKVHARNIYSKLAVKNRTQAVAQAKALGILAAD